MRINYVCTYVVRILHAVNKNCRYRKYTHVFQQILWILLPFMCKFPPLIILIKVDFPTFGIPITSTLDSGVNCRWYLSLFDSKSMVVGSTYKNTELRISKMDKAIRYRDTINNRSNWIIFYKVPFNGKARGLWPESLIH